MTEKLHNPDLPAGEIVEKREDGVWVRNDGVELHPAEKNPFYVIATVFGPQKAAPIDRLLHTRNKRIWNGWACAKLSEGQKVVVSQELDLDIDDLRPLDPNELKDLRDAFSDRLGFEIDIPQPSEIDLSSTYFSDVVTFEECVFPTTVQFSNSVFNELISVRRSIFLSEANFSKAFFRNLASFRSTLFKVSGDFSSARLGSLASFRLAKFEGLAYLRGTYFGGTATFSAASFQGTTSFREAFFSSLSSFHSAKFSKRAYFHTSVFAQMVSFRSATFERFADFREAAFNGSVDFQDGSFAAKSTFRNATFAGRVPLFFQRSMHDNTIFTNDVSHWPTVDQVFAQRDKDAFRRLRQISADQHHPENEHFFLRQEMARSAVLQDDWLSRWVIKAYGLVSSYGFSIARPGGALLALWLLPSVVFALLFKPGAVVPTDSNYVSAYLEAVPTALGFSFSNLFAFFGLSGRHFGEVWQDAPGWAHFLGGTQAVLGFILLFFLGLGLRNRFRLK